MTKVAGNCGCVLRGAKSVARRFRRDVRLTKLSSKTDGESFAGRLNRLENAKIDCHLSSTKAGFR
jgi:hypothetical protein